MAPLNKTFMISQTPKTMKANWRFFLANNIRHCQKKKAR